MAIGFGNQILFIDDDNKLLSTIAGDILCYSLYYLAVDNQPISLQNIIDIIKSQMAQPMVRISVLYPDESLNYFIPPEDIVLDGVSYNENYINGQRRNLSLKLINVANREDRVIYNRNLSPMWKPNYYYIKNTSGYECLIDKPNNWDIEYTLYYTKSNDVFDSVKYKYFPDVDGLWYGTKIKYEQGIKYLDKEYYFPKGIYIINNFDLQHTVSARDITYQCTDKFGLFEGTTGTLEDGYEVPIDTPIEQIINDILNLSGTDGYVNDQKICILDSKFSNFKTQSTIRVDAGGTISNIIEQLATQMSAEYYYNMVGHLVFYPVDESMNDINKPILWVYDEDQMEGLQFTGKDDVVNVVKVIGNNVDGKIYSAIAKNTNLQSPINIYRIKERKTSPIDTANVWSDDMAQELADFNLRKYTILNMQQSCTIPYNPLLVVNNIIEVENTDLNLRRNKYLVNSISYTSGSATMSIEIANLTNLPAIGGIKYDGQ